jgi:hypothetical protein
MRTFLYLFFCALAGAVVGYIGTSNADETEVYQLVIEQCEQADDLVYCSRPKVYEKKYKDWDVCYQVGKMLTGSMPLPEGYFWDITCK